MTTGQTPSADEDCVIWSPHAEALSAWERTAGSLTKWYQDSIDSGLEQTKEEIMGGKICGGTQKLSTDGRKSLTKVILLTLTENHNKNQEILNWRTERVQTRDCTTKQVGRSLILIWLWKWDNGDNEYDYRNECLEAQ